jgi:hypothetical protein
VGGRLKSASETVARRRASTRTCSRITYFNRRAGGQVAFLWVCDLRVFDLRVCDPGVCDPGVCDPGVCDPGVCDPGVCDPGVSSGAGKMMSDDRRFPGSEAKMDKARGSR